MPHEADPIKKLLKAIAAGETSAEAGFRQLRHLPYQSMGFATLDHHRTLRQGFPEAIFCEGKSDAQVLAIFARMAAVEPVVLATRVMPSLAAKIKRRFRAAVYSPVGRTVALCRPPLTLRPGRIALLSAGTADLFVVEEAKATAEALGYRTMPFYDIGVAGLHRLLDRIVQIDEEADVVIVAAGMDGLLPGVVGGLTGRPVIAVPTSVGYGTGAGGIAALLTMLNACAAGVAVVNIDNGFGAAILAHRILAHRLPARNYSAGLSGELDGGGVAG